MADASIVADPITPPSVLDRCVGVLLLGLLLLECLVVGSFGAFVGMASDGCVGRQDQCREGVIMLGVVIATIGQLVPLALAGGWLLRRWFTGRTIWFVGLAVSPLPVLLVLIGALIAETGVP
ncbi:hypothetical protein ASG73_11865 [Janibacter sp. Soil728]|uniref:hypothetical protein n=1 Tax=Janibacter sp. Soil728 TaxID=1736393 RepID=UPI0006F8F79D|nr:hypothetical protein [Janibacter sp. Soil728]KRE37002.1 hypothetical protein ASG73_11865 [Janibacter sp. Soil728]